MVNDTVADLLTRIRNAAHARHKTTVAPHAKLSKSVLEILKKEGYIEAFEEGKDAEGKFKQFKIFMRYDENGFPAITEMNRYSKPGRRVYAPKDKLPKVRSGLGISVISTSEGVMTDREAKKRGIGGEIIATVF